MNPKKFKKVALISLATLFGGFILMCVVIGVVDHATGNTVSATKKPSYVPDVRYKVFKSEVGKSGSKILLYTELEKRYTEEELEAVANKIKGEWKEKERVFIFHYLKGDTVNLWATTHFTPDLNVNILGATEETAKKMKDTKVKGKVIGKWHDKGVTGIGMITLYKDGETYHERITFNDGQEMDIEFIKKKQGGKDRYEHKERNPHGEYYLVESNGNLGMYGENGKFREAVKVK